MSATLAPGTVQRREAVAVARPHIQRAVELRNAGQAEAAMRDGIIPALNAAPDDPVVQMQAGVTLIACEVPELAMPYLMAAHEAMPDAFEPLYNLGHGALTLGDDATAAQWFTAALAHPLCKASGKRVYVWRALADAWYRLGEFQKAWALDAKIAEDRTHGPHATHLRALTLLRRGDWARGWVAAEARHDIAEFLAIRAPHEPANGRGPTWDGTPGQTVLAVAEQGYGDMLQFARYLPWLADVCGRPVPVTCPAPLVDWFAGLDGVASVTPAGAAVPAHDASITLMSLPRLHGTRPATVPPPVCPPAYEWRGRSRRRFGARVGIAWKGGDVHRYIAHDRSCHDDAAWGVLWTMPDVEWVPVQLGEPPAGAPFAAATYADFCDTAATMRTLDAVVTVDSAPAHLAGSCGVPTWVLPPTVPEWRWGLGATTPWYPSLRLVRRRRAADWAPALAQVRDALATFLSR